MSGYHLLTTDKVIELIKLFIVDSSDEASKVLNGILLELIKHNCHIEGIKLLLEHSRININDIIKTELQKNNNIEIIKLLLSHPKSVKSNDYIVYAVNNNNRSYKIIIRMS